jgi:hypothetical protein
MGKRGLFILFLVSHTPEKTIDGKDLMPQEGGSVALQVFAGKVFAKKSFS